MASSILEDLLDDPSFFNQLFAAYRHSTFRKWPYDPKSSRSKNKFPCTSEAVSKAGFIHDEGACASCVFCGKSLEFDPEDDPFEEHRSHSPTCVFLPLMDKPEEEWTGRDMKVLLAALLTESSMTPLKNWNHEVDVQIAKTHARIQSFEIEDA